MWRGGRQYGSAPRATVLDILRAAAGTVDTRGIHVLDARLVRWAVWTGLGPLLRRFTPPDSPLVRSPDWPLVVGADLAARLESAEQVEATLRILDACRGRLAPPLLLKGIALAASVYPEPHLRPMRDVDLLVDAAEVPALTAVLAELGFRPEVSHDRYEGHHHARPMTHPRSGVCIEVHHRLFRGDGPLGAMPLFDPQSVRAHEVDAVFHGRSVRRLSPEMQLLHVAAHWSTSAKLLEGPGGLLPLLDVSYLLASGTVRWPVVVEESRRTDALPGLYALLAYGTARGVLSVPEDVLAALRAGQRAFGPLTEAVLFRLLDRGAAQGRRAAPLFGPSGGRALWKALFLPGPPWRNLACLPRLLWQERAA